MGVAWAVAEAGEGQQIAVAVLGPVARRGGESALVLLNAHTHTLMCIRSTAYRCMYIVLLMYQTF